MTSIVAHKRLPVARLVACAAAVLGTVPYLTLKLSWLTGGTIGLTNPSFVDSPKLFVGNLITAAMDATAIVLALALTFGWGRRIPAPLVLFPAWIGSGLLAPIVLVFPVIGADLLNIPAGKLPLENWVWGVVYGGFAWQGIALLTAFVLHVRDRWPALRTSTFEPRVNIVTCVAAATTAVFQGVLAFTGTGSMSAHVMDGVFGALTLIATAAAATRGRLWPRLVAVWVGTGSMAGWGAWMLFSTLTGGSPSAQVPFYVVQVLAGVALMARVLQATYAGSSARTDARRTAGR